MDLESRAPSSTTLFIPLSNRWSIAAAHRGHLSMSYAKAIDGKRILITGGTGSFGHQVLDGLKQYNPAEIIVFSRDEDKQHRMRQENKDVRFVIGDIRDQERLVEVARGVDIIFQAAALKHVPYCETHPYEAVKTNVIGAHNVRRAAVLNNVERVIAISTDKAVKPINAMGISKAMQEKIFISGAGREHGTTFACVRYGNVIGSRGSVIPFWEQRIKQKQPMPITHEAMSRFMLTLPQAMNLVFHALANAKGGEIFVKKAPACKIVDFARAYAQGVTGDRAYPTETVGIRPGEKLHEILVSEEEMLRASDAGEYYVISPQKEFFLEGTQGQGSAYASNTTQMMDQAALFKILKETNWIA